MCIRDSDIVVKVDKLISEEVKEYDVIVLPGGMPGATNLRDNEEAVSYTHLDVYKRQPKRRYDCYS